MAHYPAKQYYGPDGIEECEKYINNAVRLNTTNYNHAILFGESPNFESVAQIKPKTVKDNYYIAECKWSPEYINYMKEIYNLRNKILFMKWKVGKDY
jgi:hypothetical protein